MLFPDANPGRRGGKPATNRLSYGTAFPINYSLIITSSDTELAQSDVRLLNCILQVPGLNAGRDTDNPKFLHDFPQFIQANAGIVPRNGPR
jgi:hypothetical protein